MITFVSGDIFESGAPVIVNTVNCKGVMGAGLALACKQRWPSMFEDYRRACVQGEVRPGRLHTWTSLTGDLTVVNFPTKDDWRLNSEYSYIESGLIALRAWLEARPGTRIAIPALGCSHGRLKWERVREMIEQRLSALDADILVYVPLRIPLPPYTRSAAQRSGASTPLPHAAQSTPARRGESSMFLPITEPSQVTPDLTNRILAVTGHRPNKLAARNENPYGEFAQGRLVKFVRAWLERLRPMGTVTGMALGLDTAVAVASRDLCIPYLCALPFKNQGGRWPDESRRLYDELLSTAAKVVVVSPGEYSAAKMQIRNEFMVNTALNHKSGAGLLFALWNSTSGGTKNCVDYAQREGLPIINGWSSFSRLLA